ncbi:kynurenine formamidase [Lutibacter sp. Hel_I_33_5]|uniref:cyclase family protein n=1 Tax=Lutibacter sp. Hel_I_33_5 TaxID=1566289 RepID=UPI0011A65458|nr:cyclase family protein [Lutibacter sp. Hel_I_33_5]TVZ55498.1 kynurenine formamidase [Lutibacter sp. Hel_I_33_5]
MTLFLSYFINEQTPIYGGEKAVFVEKRSEISKGASSNTKYLKLPNHSGTHIDFPNHFSDEGKIINDYPASFWQFKKVYVILYTAKSDEIIDEKLIKNNDIPVDTEFLIINTKFGRYREEKIYWNNNPGLSPSFATQLKIRCPNIKAIGFDFISLTSYQNRLLGRVAHKSFLLANDILLIEDMKLDQINGKVIKSVTALPLLIDKVDGCPISIIAEYE